MMANFYNTGDKGNSVSSKGKEDLYIKKNPNVIGLLNDNTKT